MKIEQVEQVLEIAKTGSLSKAAKNLYISQPSLSLSIRNLEQELGSPIFERGTKGMTLTDFGTELVAVLEPLYNQISIIPQLFAARRESDRMSFSMSNSHIKFAMNVFIELVNHFKTDPANYFCREANSGEILEDVASNRSDIGVLYILSSTKSFMMKLFESKGVAYHRLLDDGYWIIVGSRNPLFHKKLDHVTLRDIEPYPLVLYEEDYQSNLVTSLRNIPLKADTVIRVDNRAGMTELVSATDAVNIGALSRMPYHFTPFYPQLKTIELRDFHITQEIGWICRTNYDPNEYARFFIDRITEITKEGNGEFNKDLT